jgi:alkaline phosphatase
MSVPLGIHWIYYPYLPAAGLNYTSTEENFAMKLLDEKNRQPAACGVAPRMILYILFLCCAQPVLAQARAEIRIMPPDQAKFLVGQLFDLRVEATSLQGEAPPAPLRVRINGRDLSAQNFLAHQGVGGAASIPGRTAPGRRERPAAAAPKNTTNFLLRDFSFARPGSYLIEAATEGVTQRVTIEVVAWRSRQGRGVRNVIFLLGDGMSAAHRTAARVVSRGFIATNAGAQLTLPLNAPTQGKTAGRLAMDEMEATGMVMTSSLNALVTDSAPGMAAYSTGNKSNNNQEGVFPDNTPDAFDNPRVEYLGEYLRRMRGPGFNVGIVTTADVTDATPAANAVHTADRNAGAGIAAQFFDERDTNGVTVLLGGGSRHFLPKERGGERADGRDLVAEFAADGYQHAANATELRRISNGGARRGPARLLGLFHPRHLTTAFDKLGAAKGYSRELALEKNKDLRDQPMLDEMARAAISALRHSPRGFFLMIEGASIDKRTHDLDAERAIWDTIEFDNAVRVALEFAAQTNRDRDPANDTLVVVTADHDCGGMALIGVGNERYYPPALGQATRDYVATMRFRPEQALRLFPNYERDAQGFPVHPDPTRKLIIGWAAATDRYENWISNRLELKAITVKDGKASANPARDGADPASDNQTVEGKAIPGLLIPGQVENGEHHDPNAPADTSSVGVDYANHTATDIPLSASGPGAQQFVGVYDNTEGFFKIMNAYGGRFRRR